MLKCTDSQPLWVSFSTAEVTSQTLAYYDNTISEYLHDPNKCKLDCIITSFNCYVVCDIDLLIMFVVSTHQGRGKGQAHAFAPRGQNTSPLITPLCP
jgi:hypothetical protein